MKKATLIISIIALIVSIVNTVLIVTFLNGGDSSDIDRDDKELEVDNFLAEEYEYTSTGTLYIQNNQGLAESEEDSVTLSDVNSSRKLIPTIESIVTTRTVLNYVISELELDMTASELRERISVERVDDTTLLRVSVSDDDAERSSAICNSVMKFAVGVISDELGVDAYVVDQAETSNKININ